MCHVLQVIFAINYTLSYLEWGERRARAGRGSQLARLVRLYRCGSAEVASFQTDQFETDFRLGEQFDRQARQVDQQLKLDIIEHRNVRMAARTHRLLQAHPDDSFLIAVGTGELLQ